jgi:lipoyl-dependent peroxiredoxin
VRLDVGIPSVDYEVSEEFVHTAYGICPYFKAAHGDIAVETNIV